MTHKLLADLKQLFNKNPNFWPEFENSISKLKFLKCFYSLLVLPRIFYSIKMNQVLSEFETIIQQKSQSLTRIWKFNY